MKLRPHQQTALEKTMESFRSGNNFTLLQAPTGYGKTVLFSSLIKQSIEAHNIKCLVLAHQKELVAQAKDKLLAVAPELEPHIGVFCASLDSDKQQGQITVASVQSLSNASELEAYNLVIIDEVHRLPDLSKDSQYKGIIERLLRQNGRLRVLGVTATPYRLKDGLIYGQEDSWFHELCYSTTLEEMIDAGYLCEYRYKVADGSGAREAANKTDFTNDALGAEMAKEIHLGSVKKAIDEHAQGRKKILVFAVNIFHSEELARVLGCKAVHSQMDREAALEDFIHGEARILVNVARVLGCKAVHSQMDREAALEDFIHGEARILVNVDVLSTGFDFPDIDCVVQARPTLSPSLWVQLCGRSLRLKSHGGDAMILDLVGNYVRHADLSDPHIADKDDDKKKVEREEAERQANICPECFELVDPEESACPECGCDMAHREDIKLMNEREELKEIQINKMRDVIDRTHIDTDHTTKSGARGNLCTAYLKSGRKVFHFFSNRYAGTLKRVAKFEALKEGQKVKIEDTDYGPKLKGFMR